MVIISKKVPRAYDKNFIQIMNINKMPKNIK
jgi:hypothetical protein